jgi:two-component system, NtrC family, sensor kinase
MLNQLFSIPRLILLSNDLASTHSVRKTIRRAGLTVALEPVSSRDEFFSRLQNGPVDLILAAASGFEGIDVGEIVDQARSGSHHVPIVLLGRDVEDEHMLETWRDGTADFVRVSEFDRLPSILERVLREERNKSANARVQNELDRAADILCKNQKLIAIGRLTASIAHEINNPLESITNLLYLMEVDQSSPDKWSEYLHLAQRELNRVVQISKQTLTFSRETTSPLRTQLSDLIEEVLTLYRRRISDKNLNVVRQFESSEKVTVFPGEMRQVLSNLIANAIEATEPGGRITFRIRSARNWSDQGVRGIRLSISDSGAGMPASVRKRLGEPFFTTKGQHGTGLGLWVTRSILNRYGGSLQLRSSVDPNRHGTVFSMFLPTNMRPQMVQPRNNAPNPSLPGAEAGDAAQPIEPIEGRGQREAGRWERRGAMQQRA